MGIRFRKSIKICPGVKINISKSGLSTSVGVRGAHLTAGSSGIYSNVGLPGTGIYSRNKVVGTSTKLAEREPVDSDVLTEDSTAQEELVTEAELRNERVLNQIEVHKKDVKKWHRKEYEKESFPKEKPEYKPHFVIKLFSFIVFIILCACLCNSYGFLKGFPFALIITLLLNYGLKSYRKAEFEKSKVVVDWKSEKKIFDDQQNRMEEQYNERMSKTPVTPSEILEDSFYDVALPYETLISYEIHNSQIWLDVDLPEMEDMPEEVYRVRGRGRYKTVEEEQKSDRQIKLDYARHVHGVAFIITRIVFQELSEIEEVVISAYTQRVSKVTGNENDDYIYSVKILRSEWEAINLENLEYIDPTETMGSFNIRRNMTKTGIFKTIEPFEYVDQ